MKIVVETPNHGIIVSKSTPMAIAQIEAFTDSLYRSIDSLDKLKITLEDRVVIVPEDVLKKSIITIVTEPEDHNLL